MIDALSSSTSVASSLVRGPGFTSSVKTSASTEMGVGAPQAATPVSFSDVLAEVSSNTVDKLKASEAAAISGVQGKASVQSVVEAIMSAEQSLQTVVAVRDKVVAAYQEISRMAI